MTIDEIKAELRDIERVASSALDAVEVYELEVREDADSDPADLAEAHHDLRRAADGLSGPNSLLDVQGAIYRLVDS